MLDKKYEENGISIEEYTLAVAGRNLKTESEISQEKNTFLSEIFDAFEKWQKKGNKRKLIQKELASQFAWKELDKEKKLSLKLKDFGFKINNLWKVFSEHSNKENFISHFSS